MQKNKIISGIEKTTKALAIIAVVLAVPYCANVKIAPEFYTVMLFTGTAMIVVLRAFDFSGIIDAILIIVLVPSLFSMITSVAGVSLDPSIQQLLNTFTAILPVIVLFDVISDVFKGMGGKAGSMFSSIMDILLIMMVLPTLLNAISGFTGGTVGSDLIALLQQLLPLIVVIDLFTGLLKR